MCANLYRNEMINFLKTHMYFSVKYYGLRLKLRNVYTNIYNLYKHWMEKH